MAKFNKTTAILGGVGVLGLLGAVTAAFLGKKKTNEPPLIEGECEEIADVETYSEVEE